MSDLRTQIITTLDDIAFAFTREISLKYEIPQSELMNYWKKCEITSEKVENTQKIEEVKTPQVVESPKPQESNVNEREKYEKMKKTELSKLCKEKGLKTTGKKDDLIDRLLNGSPTPKKGSIQTKLTDDKKTILQSISTAIPTVSIRRNKFGNYEHPETGLVFGKVDKCVYGKQNENATIDPLTPELIELCNKYKFKFVLPENLNTKNQSLDDIALNEEDVDEEEDEILDDDDIEEIEEEEDDDGDLGEFYEDD